MLYGVAHEGNVDTRRATAAVPGNFPLEYSGTRALTGYTAVLAPLYTDDKSIAGPSGASAVGSGNYRPAAASPLAGRALRGNADVDADGLTRRVPFASGAYQAVAVNLAPASARSPGRAGAAAVTWSAVLAARASRHGLAGAATVNWTVTLAVASGAIGQFVQASGLQPLVRPGSGQIVHTAGAALLDWRGSLKPAITGHGTSSASPMAMVTFMVAADGDALPLQIGTPVIGFAASLLPTVAILSCVSSDAAVLAVSQAPLGAAGLTLPHFATRPLMLGDDARAAATLIVGPDPRTLVPTRN